MSGGMEALCLRLLELARAQKAALEAGNLDEALTLAGKRQQVIQAIQKNDGAAENTTPPGQGVYNRATGANGKPSAPASVVREILSVDQEASDIVRDGMRTVSLKLSEINIFKVFCQGVCDESRTRGNVPAA